MALTPQNNQAFLREVDEELRKEQAAALWKRWGLIIAIVIVVGLASFGGYLFWQSQQREAAGRDGERFQAAWDDLAAQRIEKASAPLAALAQSKSDGYRAAAMFTQADLLLQKDDLKGAAAKFGAIAADESLGDPFRHLALVRQTTAEFDTLKPDQVVARLRGVAVPENAYFGSAGELVALAYLKQGRRDLAGRLFGQMAQDEKVPPTIRQRAVQMAGVLGVDAVPAEAGSRSDATDGAVESKAKQ
ncbi:tetratricopeptide repeat protein [Sphingomonas radiodurans]|uniref:tetratricopeptide repeat protein n=1 Tax=Sphingomonas radiodurans TaxID=2890321 RepID=UPI001E5DDB98|nr:tetratricopeptide repeat protein [Sphingomonas radiodurans]WBH16327.1 tetratricopeptide repeat protein [Sphingomonas radiodurans]